MNALQAYSAELADLVARAAPGVVGLERRHGQGSGYVLTNAHVVVGDRGPIVVRLSGARAVRGEVVGVDERSDLAHARARPAARAGRGVGGGGLRRASARAKTDAV